MAHALSEHPLPGLDEARLERLSASGIATLEDVARAGAGCLVEATGFDDKTCQALVRVATAAIGTGQDRMEAATDAQADAPVPRLAIGLRAARRIEHARALVRRARSDLGKEPEKDKWERHHDRARRELKRMLRVLEVLQTEVLAEGVTELAYDHLKLELGSVLHTLADTFEEPMGKRTLKRIRRLAHDSCDRIEAGLL